MLKVGLLGAGRIGVVHASAINFHPGSELVALSDISAKNANNLAQRYACAVRETEEIIADPKIDAVVIATSTDTHADLMEAATTAGKAVFCEKPVDLSLARARACLEQTAPNEKSIMIGW